MDLSLLKVRQTRPVTARVNNRARESTVTLQPSPKSSTLTDVGPNQKLNMFGKHLYIPVLGHHVTISKQLGAHSKAGHSPLVPTM